MRHLLAKLCGVDSYMRALRLTNEQMSNEIAQLARDKEDLKATVAMLRDNSNDNYNERVKAEEALRVMTENYNVANGNMQRLTSQLNNLASQFDKLGREKADLEHEYNDTLSKLTKRNFSLMGTIRQLKKKQDANK